MYVEYRLLSSGDVMAFNDYYEAIKEAEKQNLLLAEYGDVYGSNMAYAYWNKTGNRNDDEIIIAYYKFDGKGKPIPLSEKELRKYLFS